MPYAQPMEPDADVRSVLGRIATGPPLSESDAERLFECLLRGGLDEARIAGVLALLAAREPTPDEVVGAARAMRRHVAPVPAPDPGSIIDTCGTGGTGKTFNVSTAVALVAAGAGARVAKHGNRSRTGRGSAEVLAALGVNVDATPRVQAACLDRAGVCFCFAIHHHPAARHAAGVRRALGTPDLQHPRPAPRTPQEHRGSSSASIGPRWSASWPKRPPALGAFAPWSSTPTTGSTRAP